MMSRNCMTPSTEQDTPLPRSHHNWQTPYILPGDNPADTALRPKKRKSKEFHKTRLLNRLRVEGKNVLDMGCSDGVYSFYLAQNGAIVTGTDLDIERLERAQKISEKLGVKAARFVQPESVAKGNPHERFDVAVAYGFLHRVADPFNFLVELGSSADTLALEFRAPALLPVVGMGVGLHNPFGYFEWKNLSGFDKVNWSDAKEYRQESRVLADFWRLQPSFVVSFLRRLNFVNFQIDVVRNEYRLASYFGAASKVVGGLFRGHESSVLWPYSRRVHIVASRVNLRDVNDPTRDTSFSPAEWDGRLLQYRNNKQ